MKPKSEKPTQAAYDEGQREHREYMESLPPPTRESVASHFRTYAESIRKGVASGEAKDQWKWTLYRDLIRKLVRTAQDEIKDCPGLGEVPGLLTKDGQADYPGAFAMLLEYCERSAERTEAAGERQDAPVAGKPKGKRGRKNIEETPAEQILSPAADTIPDDDELQVMYILDERETLTKNETIKQVLRQNKQPRSLSTVKAIIRRLIDKGWAVRPRDRAGVQLTDAGKVKVQS